jgi:hypothetical protein
MLKKMDMVIYTDKKNPEHNLTISVQYFDFIPPQDPTPVNYFNELLSNTLFNLAYLLKQPLYRSLGLFTRYLFSNPYTNLFIQHRYANAVLGLMGITVGFFPWIMSLAIAQLAIRVEGKPLKYLVSPYLITDTKCKPPTIRTHNLALITEWLTNHSGLRPAIERLPALIKGIRSAKKTDALFFQEVMEKEYAAILVKELQKIFKYVIYDVAPHPFLDTSGLVIATNKKPIRLRYLQFPSPVIVPSEAFPGFTISGEAWTNKGCLLVVVENGVDANEEIVYEMFATAHTKSNNGSNPTSIQFTQAIRSDHFRIFQQGALNFCDELAAEGIDICRIFALGDFNSSDVDEHNVCTYERTGHRRPENDKDRRTDRKDNSFFFDNFLPNEAKIDTWMDGINHEHPITFDHASFFELIAKGYSLHSKDHCQGPKNTLPHYKMRLAGGNKFSKGKVILPSDLPSDHAPLKIGFYEVLENNQKQIPIIEQIEETYMFGM